MNTAWELQKAVYAQLSGDATLLALVNGIFDFVPQDTDFPYIIIKNPRVSDWSTKTTQGAKVDFEVEIFTRERGSKSCFEIIDRIDELLDDASLTVTGHTLVDLQTGSAQVTQQRDGLTYHGILRFNTTLEEN